MQEMINRSELSASDSMCLRGGTSKQLKMAWLDANSALAVQLFTLSTLR